MDNLLQQGGACLEELEHQYLRIGVERCKGLEDHSQLSAFLMVGIRSISLLRGMLYLLQSEFLDTYDCVRRSFIESWQLQLELKLRESATKAQKWLESQPDTWKVNRGPLEALIERLHGEKAGLAREWGELSEVSHPTLQAVVNSVSVASTRAGVNPKPQLLSESLEKLLKDCVGMVNREIWLTLQDHQEFIETSIKTAELPICLEFHKVFLTATVKASAKHCSCVEGPRPAST